MKMNRAFIVVSLASIALVAEARLPHNSYITRPTPSKASFVKLVESDPVVMDRYMRHFAMNRAEVMDYMSQVSMSKLKEGGLYTVYNVPAATGELRSRLLKMKKGTPIWVDRFGTPVMVVACGNPMTRGPKSVIALDKPNERPTLNDTVEAAPRVGDEEVVVASQPSPVAETPELVAYQPAMPTTETEITNVVPDKVVEPMSISRKMGGGFLAAVPLAALAINRKNSVVPEPASALVLAAGAALFVARRKK